MQQSANYMYVCTIKMCQVSEPRASGVNGNCQASKIRLKYICNFSISVYYSLSLYRNFFRCRCRSRFRYLWCCWVTNQTLFQFIKLKLKLPTVPLINYPTTNKFQCHPIAPFSTPAFDSPVSTSFATTRKACNLFENCWSTKSA